MRGERSGGEPAAVLQPGQALVSDCHLDLLHQSPPGHNQLSHINIILLKRHEFIFIDFILYEDKLSCICHAGNHDQSAMLGLSSVCMSALCQCAV